MTHDCRDVRRLSAGDTSSLGVVFTAGGYGARLAKLTVAAGGDKLVLLLSGEGT